MRTTARARTKSLLFFVLNTRPSLPFSSHRYHYFHSDGGGSEITDRNKEHDKKFKMMRRRLVPLVELALEYGPGSTVADIGTDHGLLALALARTNQFRHIVGVDRSALALENGALQQQQIPNGPSFRLGDGLQGLQVGEADTTCIAGMGVKSMLRILGEPPKATLTNNTLGIQRLILQPTNSRPKNLMMLYDTLHEAGWEPTDEKFDYLSSYWYVTTVFHRISSDKHSSMPLLPGHHIVKHQPIPPTFLSWVEHQCKWITKNQALKKQAAPDEQESRWMKQFSSLVE